VIAVTDTHGWYGAVTTHQDQLSPRQQQQQQQQQQQLVLDPVLVANRMQRYSQVILKLQQLLQSERRTARALRVRYGDELARRTAVQGLLMGQLQSLGEQSRWVVVGAGPEKMR
jgi:cell division inhibitor SulA